MGEQKVTEYTEMTTTAAGTKLYVISTIDQFITLTNLFGGTGGIPIPVGVRITPAYTIHAKNTGANCTIVAERDAGASFASYATSTSANFGSISAHATKIIANSSVKVTIGTDGSITAPDVYGDTGNGTDIDLYCDSTGLFGAHPSGRKYKINERPVIKSEIDKILSLPVKIYDFKNGGAKNEVGLIAEDTAAVLPEIVSYRTYRIENGVQADIIRSEYADIAKKEKELIPGEQKKVILMRIIPPKLETDEETLVPEEVDLISVPESVNRTKLIPFLIAKIQELETRLTSLEIK